MGRILRYGRCASDSERPGDLLIKRAGVDGEIKRLILSDATYASNIQCKHTYVQISCLSVHPDGISLVLRTAKMACVASSLVITSPNGQVTMVVSTGISSSATIL